MTLIRIKSDHFVAGLLIDKMTVIKTAPILKYMLDWDVDSVRNYCKNKNWELIILNEGE